MTTELIIYNCHKSRVSKLCVCDRLHSRVDGFDDGVDKGAWASVAALVGREPTIQVRWISQAGIQNLHISPRCDGLLAFLDLFGGHGLRVDGLHDVVPHVLEAAPSEALISQLTAFKAAVEHSLHQ